VEISFRIFLNKFMEYWRNSSLNELKEVISIDYQAREITGGKIIDFGYDESISGWEQGFVYVKENNAQWDLKEVSVIPLRDNENMVILSASLIINGKKLETANLFFQTFKTENNSNWKLIRSYIEAGIQLDKKQFAI
jgi:hypothetical protein